MCQDSHCRIGRERGRQSTNKVTIIGIDLAKRVLSGAWRCERGKVVFRKKLSRSQLLPFLAAQSPCIVAMEACATAHEWGRSIGELGHKVRLVPPRYVKPYVKRQKNDTADAEAIAEAASRPTTRFVAVKTRRSSPLNDFPDARSAGTPAHTTDQRLARASCRTWRSSHRKDQRT